MVGWHHQPNGHESEQLQVFVMDRDASHVSVHGVTKTNICYLFFFSYGFSEYFHGLNF